VPAKESISSEAIPKSAARIINALKIRDDYRRKRNSEEGTDDKVKHRRRRTEDTRKIQPGESIQHFYRCELLGFGQSLGSTIAM